MKIKELYLQALEKISEKDAKKILLCLSLGTMVAVADYVGLFDTNKDNYFVVDFDEVKALLDMFKQE